VIGNGGGKRSAELEGVKMKIITTGSDGFKIF
jgi:hypothetical protein